VPGLDFDRINDTLRLIILLMERRIRAIDQITGFKIGDSRESDKIQI